MADLITTNTYEAIEEAESFLKQTLTALDYLVSQGILHRDIKPANILATKRATGFWYCLTDFGVSNYISAAKTFAGSPMYMAPELWETSGLESKKQSPAMDVWSLGVSLIEAVDTPAGTRQGLRDAANSAMPKMACKRIIDLVSTATSHKYFETIRGMFTRDPMQRTSAGDIIDSVFGGEGRSSKPTRAAFLGAKPKQKIPIFDDDAALDDSKSLLKPKAHMMKRKGLRDYDGPLRPARVSKIRADKKRLL